MGTRFLALIESIHRPNTNQGGYATALVLAKDTVDPVFACGISVAPVTSWLLYGTFGYRGNVEIEP